MTATTTPHQGSEPFAGQIAVVTGTAQGIGTAIADELEAAGAQVLRVDRTAPGTHQREHAVDLADTDAVSRFFGVLDRVDVLAMAAGGVVGQTHTPIDEVTDEDWNAVLDANLRSAFNCVRAATPLMKRREYGRIVTIASGAGRSVSLTGIQAYTSAKAGLIGFTRQCAFELGRHGITVNCIAPGFVLSNPTTRKQWDGYGEDGQASLLDKIAVGRLGEPADIARGALFFAHPDAGWVSGQVLSIDGGHSMF